MPHAIDYARPDRCGHKLPPPDRDGRDKASAATRLPARRDDRTSMERHQKCRGARCGLALRLIERGPGLSIAGRQGVPRIRVGGSVLTGPCWRGRDGRRSTSLKGTNFRSAKVCSDRIEAVAPRRGQLWRGGPYARPFAVARNSTFSIVLLSTPLPPPEQSDGGCMRLVEQDDQEGDYRDNAVSGILTKVCIGAFGCAWWTRRRNKSTIRPARTRNEMGSKRRPKGYE